MAEVYELEITTNATEYPLEKKYPAAITLNELKVSKERENRTKMMRYSEETGACRRNDC